MTAPSELVLALVRLRYRAGMTQEDIAVYCDCSSRHVLQFENGRVDARLSFIQRYARACGAKIEIDLSNPEYGIELEIVLPEGLEPTLNSS